MNLKTALRAHFTKEELSALVQGYDIVGDIAIIIIPDNLKHHQDLIAQTILALNKKVKVVCKRKGHYHGTFRTIALKHLAGENREETVHTEFGIKFHLNPSLVYFSGRIGHERKRIAGLVEPDEDVLVMFSGIGAYPLMIARHSGCHSVTGIELNPAAHRYALQNQKLNKLESRTIFHQGDVYKILPLIKKRFNRIVMPLPRTSLTYLPLALSALKNTGFLHLYDFQSTRSQTPADKAVTDMCQKLGKKIIASKTTICGHTSPTRNRICIDAHLCSYS